MPAPVKLSHNLSISTIPLKVTLTIHRYGAIKELLWCKNTPVFREKYHTYMGAKIHPSLGLCATPERVQLYTLARGATAEHLGCKHTPLHEGVKLYPTRWGAF